MTEDNEIVRHRREKLAALRAQGNSFPNDFRRTAVAADLQARYGDVEQRRTRVARRSKWPSPAA